MPTTSRTDAIESQARSRTALLALRTENSHEPDTFLLRPNHLTRDTAHSRNRTFL